MQQHERRVMTGLNLFPNIVSVDLDVLDKRSKDGFLLLLISYKYDQGDAKRLAEALRQKVKTIKQTEIKVKVTRDLEKFSHDQGGPAGIFLTEHLSDEQFEKILKFAIEHHVLVFSPFAGDVERGATAGLSISSRIQPYYNAETLMKSKIRFHHLFLKVAKSYE